MLLACWTVDDQLLELRGPGRILLLLFLLHQLLRGLEVLQGDALSRPPRLSDALGVRLSLDLVLFIAHRRNERSTEKTSYKQIEHIEDNQREDKVTTKMYNSNHLHRLSWFMSTRELIK